MRAVVGFGLLASATASAAMADSPFTRRGGDDSADTVAPKTSYPLGESQLVAESLARNVRMYWIERGMCDQLGCLIVRNDTHFYKVAEFRIELLGRDGSSRWSRNQLLRPLLPKDKIVRLKLAPADSCERDIMFVLQHRKTRERLVMEGTTNFCPTPRADNLIRIEGLDDLVGPLEPRGPALDPAASTDGELLDAALDGLAILGERLADAQLTNDRLRRRLRGKEEPRRSPRRPLRRRLR